MIQIVIAAAVFEMYYSFIVLLTYSQVLWAAGCLESGVHSGVRSSLVKEETILIY